MGECMKFIWNPDKARTNLTKHDIDFETAKLVWDDSHHKIVFDRIVDDEERWWAIGQIAEVVVVVVVHSYPVEGNDALVRIISARRATKAERKRYEDDYYF